MSTSAFAACVSINTRIEELYGLVSLADQFETADEAIYNTLCRSCSILIASHIEGAIKDICKSVLQDLNYFVADFAHMPEALKRAFCRKIAFYEGITEKQITSRVDQLIEFFDANHVPIDLDAFAYLETSNKNPKPSNIDKPFERFGVNGALHALGSSFFENAFAGSAAQQFKIKRRLRQARSNLYFFPYKNIDGSIYLVPPRGRSRDVTPNLWHTYLEEVVTRRHKIVHGEAVDNPTTSEALRTDIFKAEVMLLGLVFYFCGKLTDA